MAAPSFAQIQSFTQVENQLEQAALDEFMEYVHDGMTFDELTEIAAQIAGKYAMFGCELGAQWYDLCSELAGVNAEPAYVNPPTWEELADRAIAAAEAHPELPPEHVLGEFLQNVVAGSVRDTGDANLQRDYERGLCAGKWSRVPVGETCAWCLMLASQGAWYKSQESALGKRAGHYHNRCDCVAVFHSDPDQIYGYKDLFKYKEMYYDADNRRQAAASGRDPYPDDLAQRIKDAEAAHEALEDEKERKAAARGEKYKRVPWTQYNEDLILMRDMYGLK